MENKNKEKDKKIDPAVKRANLSFLQLIFPSFLLVLIPSTINGNAFYPLLLKVLIFGYQYFLIQHFVNSIYD
jgi:hypothetical protein